MLHFLKSRRSEAAPKARSIASSRMQVLARPPLSLGTCTLPSTALASCDSWVFAASQAARAPHSPALRLNRYPVDYGLLPRPPFSWHETAVETFPTEVDPAG